MPTPQSDDDLPDDWEERLERVLTGAADDFRACSAAGEPEWLRACARYFDDGERVGFDHGELIDYLGVSSPSVLERAGYNEAQALRVMELLPLLGDVNSSDDDRIA